MTPRMNLSGAVRGWTERIQVEIIAASVVAGRKVETKTSYYGSINLQPVPQEKIDRKPLEVRSWKWFSLITIGIPALNTDDGVVIEGVRYRVQSVSDWSRQAFRKYEVIEDYVYPIPGPEAAETVYFDGNPIFYGEEVVSYAES